MNLEPKDLRPFFGDEDGDELHMILSFTMNQALYLALAREEAAPLEKALEALPPIAIENGWANFVRNHDELSLDKLTEEERQEVFAAFGPDKGMQLYGRGIRRRLPTMLDGDQRRLRLAYSLMFSLPGIPTLFYGEEIGLAENLGDPRPLLGPHADAMVRRAARRVLASRTSKRCADRSRTTRASRPERVNVADQRRDPDALLNWMERLIRQRKERPEIGWGRLRSSRRPPRRSSPTAATGTRAW